MLNLEENLSQVSLVEVCIDDAYRNVRDDTLKLCLVPRKFEGKCRKKENREKKMKG